MIKIHLPFNISKGCLFLFSLTSISLI